MTDCSFHAIMIRAFQCYVSVYLDLNIIQGGGGSASC